MGFSSTTEKGHTAQWEGIELAHQGLKRLSPDIFTYTFLKELHLDNNLLMEIPAEIGMLKQLEILNLGSNKLVKIPKQLCKCHKLKFLDLSDNLLSGIPLELGNLYNLDVLNLDRNPLLEPFASVYRQRGGIGLINFCRENNTTYPPPLDRLWLRQNTNMEPKSSLKIASYNILAPRYANTNFYMHLPALLLQPDHRNEAILQEIAEYETDVLCLQEIEMDQYKLVFSPYLETQCAYESIFFPKSRGKMLQFSERGSVDGCAIFWKRNIFQMIEQKNIELQKIVADDPFYCKNEELMARNLGKDNVAVIVLLEKINSEQLIVVNTHLFWDPKYNDIKFVQTHVLLKELEKFKSKYPNAGLVLCGDFNSTRDTKQMELLLDGKVNTDGILNLENVDLCHNLGFKNAYENIRMPLTNMAAEFQGVIDFIFYDKNIGIERVLLPPNDDYFDSLLALPSVHFPSDHIFIGAELFFKSEDEI